MRRDEFLKLIEEAERTGQTELNLSGNQIKKLPIEVTELTNLIQLNLSRNKLSELPAEISDLKNLIQLNLSRNKLSELPAEISDLKNLTKLDLSYNHIVQLPAKITKLKNLAELDLSGNQLTELPAEITKLMNLTKLDLSGNQINKLPTKIGELTNLIVLDLSWNQIKELPTEITKLTNLTGLYHTGNPLKSPSNKIANKEIGPMKEFMKSFEIKKNSFPLCIFLCHSSSDKTAVRNLYQHLRTDGFNPWLDEINLLPGQKWKVEIPKAVHASDVVIVCLSRGVTSKAGYIQKEIMYALDAAEEQPEGTIFLIPLKLEECDVPERLRDWQWVNLFEDTGYMQLRKALQKRAETISS